MNITGPEIKDLIKTVRKYSAVGANDVVQILIDSANIRVGIDHITKKSESIKKEEQDIPGTFDILKTVCDYHNQMIMDVKSGSRKEELIRVRQQYCLIAIAFNYTQESVGIEINKDHATVHFSKSRAINYYEMEKDYRNQVNIIISKFKGYESMLKNRLSKLISQ